MRRCSITDVYHLIGILWAYRFQIHVACEPHNIDDFLYQKKKVNNQNIQLAEYIQKKNINKIASFPDKSLYS